MLTPQRSFILQIDTETDLDSGRVRGRVEIIATGETRHFRSLAGMLRIVGLAGERALGAVPGVQPPAKSPMRGNGRIAE